jgi:meiotically up-regulated gene 157 (Mug157) protein
VSLAYLGFVNRDDPVYRNTREYMLSTKNPYFYENAKYKGVGSSHTPARNVWPLALITQMLTSNDDNEIRQCLSGLIAQANDNLIHESFAIDSPQTITRAWFAWANSLFGEAIIKLANEKP